MTSRFVNLVTSSREQSPNNSVPLLFGEFNRDNVFGGLYFPQIYRYSVQARYLDGTPNGTLKLQVSNDGVNFDDLPGNSFVVTGTGSFMWNVPNPGYLYAQIVWTPNGGSTGHLSVISYIREFS